jgi:uncharacterized membrane protein
LKALHLGCAVLGAAYPFATHFSAVSGRPAWGVAVLVALVGVALRLAARSWRETAAAFAPLAAVVVLVPAQVVLYLPPVVLDLALALAFGITLRRGSEPLVGRFARLERGEPLDHTLSVHTRRLTAIWAALFLAMAVAAALLAALAPVAIWSLFTNGVCYLLVTGLFVIEWLYRRIRMREYRHPPLWVLARTVARANVIARNGA